MNDLVSVIVPVYRVETLLRRCVDSILGQSYRDLEVILVDDGSPDASGAICDDYARSDERVTVIHKTNGGLSDARNHGIEAASGRYLTFVDSDDWLHPEYVGHLHRVAVDTGSDIVVSPLTRTDSEEVPLAAPVFRHRSLDRVAAMEQLVGPLHTLLTVACAKLYRAELLSGVRFPVGRLHEDEFTTYRVIDRCSNLAICETPLYFYWQHPESIMGQGMSLKRGLDTVDAFRERTELLATRYDPALRDEARAQLFRKCLQLYLWLAKRGERALLAPLMVDMRQIESELRGTSEPWSFRAFARLFVDSPRLAGFTYRFLNAVRQVRVSRPQPSPNNTR